MVRFILHTSPPFSSLPSFEPASLSALLYFHACIPSSEWNAVYATGSFGSLRFSDFKATSDDSASPSSKDASHDVVISLDSLPCLQDNLTGSFIYGLDDILRHMKECDHTWDIDSHLEAADKADVLAYSALLHTRLAPLIAAQVFGSSTNWNANNGVRTALASKLAFPFSWFVPGRIRDRYTDDAERRGYSGAEIESAVSVPSSWSFRAPKREKDWEGDSKPKETPESKSVIAARVNLRRQLLDAIEPFERLRKSGSAILGKEKPTSLGVQLRSWLALAMLDEFPVTPLADLLRETAPELVAELSLSNVSTMRKGGIGGPLETPREDWDHSIPIVERALGTVWTAMSTEVGRYVQGYQAFNETQ